ncbi:hypothetical protein BsWGS_01410 [Bradybaena similaris]
MFRCPLTASEDNLAANICAHDLGRHTSGLTQMAMNAGQHDSVQKNSKVLIERHTLQHPFQTSYISSGRNDGSCSDIGLVHSADREFADSACKPSIACLNANTNAKTNKTLVEDDGATARRSTEERADCSDWSDDEAEIRLEAVGLSLSGSGMHVFVNADTDEKKKFYADAYVQLKAKRRRGNDGRSLNASESMDVTSDQAKNYDDYHRVGRRCSRDSAVYSRDMPRYGNQAIQGTSGQPMESSPQNSPPRAHKACTHSSKGHAQCKERCVSLHQALPAREEINRQNGSKKMMPKLDKFVSQETVKVNYKDCRRDLTDPNKKNMYPHVLLYNVDALERQNSEKIRSDSQEKISKHTDSRDNRNIQQQLILSHNGNYSRNNDDYIENETRSEKRRHCTTMKMVTSPVTSNQGICEIDSDHTCNASSIHTAKEPNDSQSLHRAMTKKVPAISFPFSTDHKTAYDGVSVSDFIDYADNVRKSFKEDYRNLSNLIKEFSVEMQERNKNQSSQSGPDKPKKDRKTKANREQCILM